MKRFALPALFAALLFLTAFEQVGFAQTQTSNQTPERDPQALALMQQSLASMGTPPADSTAAGTITTTAGTRTESGGITILTRGTNQTSEQVSTAHGGILVYSGGQASNGAASLSGQQAMTSQSPCFPSPLIAASMNNPDSSFQYIGLEVVNGSSAHHIRFWNSFASNTNAQYLSEFTARDIWIDSTTYLPLRMSYVQREGGGSAPRIAIDVFYSNYQSFGGVLYPLSIQRSFNGTPSATITIQQVVFNTGLSDANFPVPQVAQ